MTFKKCEKGDLKAIDGTKVMYSRQAPLHLCWLLTTIFISFLADVFFEVRQAL